MFARFLVALTGLSLIVFTSCTSTHSATSASNKNNSKTTTKQPSAIAVKTNNNAPAPVKKDSAVVAKAPVNKIIERGGKYTYITPAYMRMKPEVGSEKYGAASLQQKIDMLKKYAADNNYNTEVAFFVDMRVKSGKNRFLVVNLKDNSIMKQALVAHGKGTEKFTFDRKFSNDEGSNCTSLGIYKIGKAYTGAFGLSYKLYGLNRSNSNAVKRYVVLHAMGSIPETETAYPIMQSEGCPAVAPAFLAELAPILDQAPKNVLLYIYYGGVN